MNTGRGFIEISMKIGDILASLSVFLRYPLARERRGGVAEPEMT